MSDTRFKDVTWNLKRDVGEGVDTWQKVEIAVMMNLRDELKKLNSLLSCPNFVAIPRILRGIRGNTNKKRKNHA